MAFHSKPAIFEVSKRKEVRAYGTFDQTGNIWEWTEAIIGSNRGLRGGSAGVAAAYWLPAYKRTSHIPGDELDYGFRVATIAEPVDPVELLMELTQKVIALNLQQGISNSLDAKLQAAMQAALEDINENNDVAAINNLEAFINAIKAQRGNKIPEADADALIADVQKIIDLLSAE